MNLFLLFGGSVLSLLRTHSLADPRDGRYGSDGKKPNDHDGVVYMGGCIPYPNQQ